MAASSHQFRRQGFVPLRTPRLDVLRWSSVESSAPVPDLTRPVPLLHARSLVSLYGTYSQTRGVSKYAVTAVIPLQGPETIG
jgi:hypothetical protein